MYVLDKGVAARNRMVRLRQQSHRVVDCAWTIPAGTVACPSALIQSSPRMVVMTAGWRDFQIRYS
jgi:hypothetical protein